MQAEPWEIRDYGNSPVSIAAKGEGPAIAKVFVTEYRKRERSPELLHALRMIAEAPAMLAALHEARRMLVEDECYQTYNPRIREFDAILARIDGEA